PVANGGSLRRSASFAGAGRPEADRQFIVTRSRQGMGRLSSISRPGAAPFAAASDVGTAALVSRYRLASGVRRDPAFARRLPAGLMPWQRAAPATTDALPSCINRA